MNRISELFKSDRITRDQGDSVLVKASGLSPCEGSASRTQMRVNIAAMGDVGSSVLLGLRLLGRDHIESIGIYDLNEATLRRFEREINQVVFPDGRKMPNVRILSGDEVFDCDVFVFCATKAIPAIGADGDVRMAQFDANRGLVELYARQAASADFKGLFAVVSDPVDPLCKAAALAGVNPERIKGFGLGVMYARGQYAADRLTDAIGCGEIYREKGRAFGPHGNDLVIVNNIEDYDDSISCRLTELAVNSNMVTREDGFKPYIAPAMSSAAISILETIRGNWNYSSIYTGEVFLGCRNRLVDGCFEVENLPVDEKLMKRIRKACDNLAKIV